MIGFSRPAWLVVASIVVLAAHGDAAAAPVVHTSPHHQSPVRGEPDDLLILPGWAFGDGAVVVYQRLDDTTQPLPQPGSVPTILTADEGIAPVVGSDVDAIVVRLPAVMLAGESYALWVRSPDGSWIEGAKINDARCHR